MAMKRNRKKGGNIFIVNILHCCHLLLKRKKKKTKKQNLSSEMIMIALESQWTQEWKVIYWIKYCTFK